MRVLPGAPGYFPITGHLPTIWHTPGVILPLLPSSLAQGPITLGQP